MYTLDDLLEDIHQDFNSILEQADYCGLGTEEKDRSFGEVVAEVREKMKGVVQGLAVDRKLEATNDGDTKMYDPEEAQQFAIGFVTGCFDKEVLSKISTIIEQKKIRGYF